MYILYVCIICTYYIFSAHLAQNDMFSINSTVTSDKADQFGNITNDFEIPASSFERQYQTRPPASSLGFPLDRMDVIKFLSKLPTTNAVPRGFPDSSGSPKIASPIIRQN